MLWDVKESHFRFKAQGFEMDPEWIFMTHLEGHAVLQAWNARWAPKQPKG